MAQTWMHCNECFYQPDKTNLRFYLTNCSHIFCEKCVARCTKDRCKLCKAQCNTMPLMQGKIPKSVQDMFSDPMELYKKNIKPFIQCYEFHKSHNRRLVKYLGQKIKYYDTQIGQAKKLVAQAKNFEKEFQRTKKENEYLRSLMARKDTQPRSNPRNKVSPGAVRSGGASPQEFSPYQRSEKSTSGDRMASQQQKRRPMTTPSGNSNYSTAPSDYNPNHYNIMNQPGRLLMRSPPEGGKLGSVGRDFSLTPNNPMRITTPDSGYSASSGDNTPLTVPRPIHFSSQDSLLENSNL